MPAWIPRVKIPSKDFKRCHRLCFFFFSDAQQKAARRKRNHEDNSRIYVNIALTRRSPTAQASIINMLNIQANKPRAKRYIFICIPMKYVPGKDIL